MTAAGVTERLTGLVGALRAHGLRIGTGETVDAAMAYQHASQDRDKVIAAALSGLAAGTVTPIARAKGKTTRRKRQAG